MGLLRHSFQSTNLGSKIMDEVVLVTRYKCDVLIFSAFQKDSNVKKDLSLQLVIFAVCLSSVSTKYPCVPVVGMFFLSLFRKISHNAMAL